MLRKRPGPEKALEDQLEAALVEIPRICGHDNRQGPRVAKRGIQGGTVKNVGQQVPGPEWRYLEMFEIFCRTAQPTLPLTLEYDQKSGRDTNKASLMA
jgi:hypothetical protein